MRYLFSVLLGLLVCLASASMAQNIVTNSGFETGDFTGWTVTGDNASVDMGTDVPHSGIFAASFGTHSPDANTLSQIFATQIGQQYTLSFFAKTPELNIPPGTPNSLAVYFGGNLVANPFQVPDDSLYHQYTYNVTAISASTQLRFAVSNDPDFTVLDDISVTPQSAAVPETNTLLMLSGMSMAGIGFLARRQKKQ